MISHPGVVRAESLKAVSGPGSIGIALPEQQLAAKTINFSFPETFAAATDQVQGVADCLQTMLDASGSQARVGRVARQSVSHNSSRLAESASVSSRICPIPSSALPSSVKAHPLTTRAWRRT